MEYFGWMECVCVSKYNTDIEKTWQIKDIYIYILNARPNRAFARVYVKEINKIQNEGIESS